MTTALPDTNYRLLILGDGSVRTIPLTGMRWTIGRALDCSITLRDPTVSRRHLLIERVGDSFQFQDLGGANPAQIDGRSARQGSIRAGQQLSIGLTRLVLEARLQPAPVSTDQPGTVIISREVADDEAPVTSSPNSFPATAARILQSIEWTFADLGDLAHAAEPLLELALNLTNRKTGWLARFPGGSQIETLAAITTRSGDFKPQLNEQAIADARRIRQPHLLKTEEKGTEHERLLIPLGEQGDGLLVLEDPRDDAPSSQELLRLAESLGKVIWHRMQETLERVRMRDELERLSFRGTDSHNALLTSTRLQSARELVRSCAADDTTVILIGESGTEREDLARYMHAESSRRANPFVCWNAAKISPDKQPLDMFGNGEQIDLMRRAAGGTLLVEHPEAMSAELQQEFAKAIRERSDKSKVRVVLAAAAAPIDGDSWAAELRQCIDSQPILIPPLRNDARDVLALAELFLASLGTCPDGSPRLMTERCKRLLTQHSWPGNVRELRLTLESAAAKAGNQPITQRHLPPELAATDSRVTPSLPTLEDVERAHIAEVMIRTGGVRSRAAQVLGIASSTLYEKLKKYKID
ncbi:MAG: transcriptional regulator with GAF, ATPase, and Fis domain [Planctomycetota bacterium]